MIKKIKTVKSLQIDGKVVENRLFLAPMAGLGHIALRELVSEFGGAGLLFTGMCNAKAVPHENPEVSHVFKFRRQELPHLVCQIFGSDSLDMAKAAKRIEQEGFFGVDLNFGCSVAAICKKGCGAALLKTPDIAVKIVEQVKSAVSIPVFVKFRIGWEDNTAMVESMAKRFENAGADLLVFHPRIAPDRRTRPPKWEYITIVKKAVNIPVFGNGNILSHADMKKMVSETSCDGVSIGRLAIAKPWIFAKWTNQLKSYDNIYHHTAIRMTDLLLKHYGDFIGVKFFKKWAPYFSANFKFSHSINKKLLYNTTMDEIRNSIDKIFQNSPEISKKPNQNLFL
ncbi:MAG: tRNA-dihydrouridine synthase family protein [Desulfobacterales bacterium]|nr:tRNA-dihydrouridine synthase family protein [Desulfobacterales bacterium]